MALLVVASALVGAMVALGRRIEPPPECFFVAAWSPHLQTGLVPDNLAAANDRRCLAASGNFPSATFQFEASSSAALLRRQLQSNHPGAHRPLVLYLSAYTQIDTAGNLVLLTKDYAPLQPAGHGIPLSDVLRLVADHAAAHKLVVLDIAWQLPCGQVGLFPEHIVSCVLRNLGEVHDPRRLALISCAPGQWAQEIPGIGRTAFGYFFEQGLRGYADSYNPSAMSDGRVSVLELAAYVRNRTDAWSNQFATSRQTPLLIGTCNDFLLGVTDLERPQPEGFAAAAADYPEWLQAAWTERDQLLAVQTLTTHPRLMRRLDETLVEVERRWRYGQAAEQLQSYFRAEVGPVVQQITKTLASTQPADVVALGQTRVAPTGEQLAAWENLLISQPAPTATLDPAALAKLQAELLAAFQEQLGDASPRESIAAALEVLPAMPGSIARHLALVDDVLHPGVAEPTLVETFMIRRLYKLAEREPTIDDATLRLALRVAVVGEQASGLPRTEPWLAPLLRRAEAHRQAGEVALFSPGFASIETAERELAEALAAYQSVRELQNTVADALTTRDRAFAELPALLPIVRDRPSLASTWFRAIENASHLAAHLNTSDHAELPTQADRIRRFTLNLQQQLAMLRQPTGTPHIDALVDELQRGEADRLLAAQALLATPLVTIDDRLRLIDALNDAHQEQLQSVVTIAADRSPATIDLAIAESRSQAGGVETTIDSSLLEARVAVALGQLAGIEMQEVATLVKRRQRERTAVPLSQISQELIRVFNAAVPGNADNASLDRLARVVPAGYYDPVLDDRDQPAPLVEARQALAAWEHRQRTRYAAVAGDSVGWQFFSDAAMRLAQPHAARPARLDVAGPTELASLSEESPAAATELMIHAHGDAQPEITVLQPTECVEAQVALRRERDHWLAHIELSMRPHATHREFIATRGLLVRTCLDGQMTHHAIGLPALSRANAVALLVDFAGARQSLRDELELPPTATPQPMVLLLENRGTDTRQLTVNVAAGQSFTTSLTLPPGAIGPIKFPPAAPDLAVSTIVDAIGIQVIDQATSESLLAEQYRLTAAEPSRYVRLSNARLLPGSQGTHVMQVAVERLPGAPKATTVTLEPVADARSGPFVVAAGSMSATLTAKKPTATLHANLKTRNAVASDAPIAASLTVDGVHGAFNLTGRAAEFGQSSLLEPAAEPRISVAAPPLLKSGDPLPFTIASVAAPAGGRIRASLFRPATTGESSLVMERHRLFPYVRQKQVAISPPGNDGHLAVRAQVTDVLGEFDTAGLMGPLQLQVELLNADNEVVARDQVQVKCDGTPSGVARFVADRAPAVAGAPREFEIVADDDLSGVDKVRLFLGMPVDDALPEGAKPLPAKRVENSQRRWLAKLPMPKDATSVDITAEVTNGVGLTRFVSIELKLLDPKQAALGKIAGGVVEGTRPQPGLEVELRTADQAVVAKAKTDAQGNFNFDAVDPGDYLVWCVKPQSQRVGASQVKVEPGATAQTSVELTL